MTDLTATEPTQETSQVQRPGLRSRVVSAGLWSVVLYAGSQILRLGSSLILTRLLMPEAYGLYTLITAYLTGLSMFSDVGLGAYLLQSKRAHAQAFADAVWTIGILRGVFIWLVGVLLAWPMSRFYGDETLLWMLVVGSFALMLGTLQSTKLVIAYRELRQKQLAALNLAVQAISVTVNCALAWWFRSAWAFIVGDLITEFARVVASQVFLPGERNRLRWDPEVARELRGFSVWIYGSSVATFLGGQVDRLLLGKLVPLEFLGLYGVAMNLAMVPQALVLQGSRLLSPLVVQLRDGCDTGITTKLQEARAVLLRAGAVLVAVMCVGAPAFFGVLYDSRYHGAAYIAAPLAVSTWAMMLGSSVGGILIAYGDAKSTAICSVARMTGAAFGMAVGYSLAGPYGIVVGSGGGPLGVYVITLVRLRKHNVDLGWSDLAYCFRAVALGALGWSLYVLARSWSFSAIHASAAGTVLTVAASLVWEWSVVVRICRHALRRLAAARAAGVAG